ncbi:methyltransferase domain-containing protein [Novosphingobium album (ex Liu et al. 2023)]|uniref:Methyltransferase domain-containing protein n=1 Tax=Novosphingobium album (ex Liu et al. 2023) TaxID=3031130 RepID=A0ABT5WPP4_9SPHN|nr:methyltransferase domain-containing protein [Novosphingobium album (ex Liu et al. 2023)]MDE8651252.1 methyltransferase domain-containing protein [Novosphingobium album (ex Liu et al. 2023)]
MSSASRDAVRRAFALAERYDSHARVQRAVAEALADRIAALPLPACPRVLEIGCGTGFLTQALRDRGIGGEWWITDIAPEMVERCRARIGEAPGRHFAVLDGEHGTPPQGPFDLICSSLAMQWFDDQGAAITRMLDWLAPGGHCLFTTLGQGSFAEWRAAHAAEGLEAGTPGFMPVARFAALLPARQAVPPEVTARIEHHAGAAAFLHALKAIGARTPARRHRPLAPAALRKVMRRFEAGGASVTYEVVTCHYTRAT